MFNKIYEFIKTNIKFIISLIVIILLFTIELPYCIYTPGGMVKLDDRVQIKGEYKSKGTFGMSYVSMVKSSVPFVLLSYVIPNWDLEKKSDISYDNMDLDETIQIDKVYMQQGINNAIIAAYNKLGKEVSIENQRVIVSYIAKENKSDLKIGDEITEVNNKKVSSIEEIRDIIKNYNKGDNVILKIKRDKKEKNINSKLIELDGEVKLGISSIDLYDLKTNPKVEVKTKDSESGPSGGLMIALEIYNSLTKEDLTGGKRIIGTGTIDEDGNVGKIDGIKYKLLGAAKKDADIFLCPSENEEEALKIKKDNDLKIKIISVSTFDDAISKLGELK